MTTAVRRGLARNPEELRRAIRTAWSISTTSDPDGWSPDNPAWGQCAVTALVVQEELGGDLLRAEVDGISHYWNRLRGGHEIDLTREQFGKAVVVPEGELRSREYVLSFEPTRARYETLRQEVESRLAQLSD